MIAMPPQSLMTRMVLAWAAVTVLMLSRFVSMETKTPTRCPTISGVMVTGTQARQSRVLAPMPDCSGPELVGVEGVYEGGLKSRLDCLLQLTLWLF